MVTSLKSPPCSRCLESDRMLNLPDTTTDFGGVVSVWVCLRCGIVAISTKGGRPSKGGPARIPLNRLQCGGVLAAQERPSYLALCSQLNREPEPARLMRWLASGSR